MLVALVGLPGCSAAEGPEGTYVLDKEAMKASMEEVEPDPDDPMGGMGLAMMEGMLDSMSMTITINADGTAAGTMGMMDENETMSGTWTMTGNNITISMGAEGEEPEAISGTMDGDTLTLNPPEDDPMPFSLVFKKQQP